MNAEPVLPDRYIDRAPGPKFCAAGGRPEGCGAVFFAIRDRTYIVAPAGQFASIAHEMCHRIQFAEGRRLSEPECEAVEAWAWSCPGATP